MKKVVAVLLAFVMMTSVITACHKSKKNNEVDEFPTVMSEDSLWYDSTEVKIGKEINYDDYEDVSILPVSVDDDSLIFLIKATQKDYMGCDVSLNFYTKDGELISSNSLNKDIVGAGEYRYENFYAEDGHIHADALKYEGAGPAIYDLNIDYEGSTVTNVDLKKNKEYPTIALHPASSIIGQYTFGGYKLDITCEFMENQYYAVLMSPNGDVTDLCINDAIPDKVNPYIYNAFMMNDNEILLLGTESNGDYFSTVIDISAGGMLDATDEYEWTEESGLTGQMASFNNEMGYFWIDYQNFIRTVDFDGKCTKSLIGFENCNINTMSVSMMQILDVTEDSVMIGCQKINGLSYYREPYTLFTFTKADKNPNAGKTILRIVCLGDGYYDGAVCEAIYRFNDISEDSFIVFDHRYDIHALVDFKDYGWEEQDKYWDAVTAADASINDQLKVDLIAGNGPDIILNGTDCVSLNKAEYLVDLAPYVEGNEELFANVVEMSKIDGKIYQLPLTIAPSGMLTTIDYIEDGQKGLTFDQYLELIDKVNNGEDPIHVNKINYLYALFSCIQNEVYSNDVVDFNVPAFRELAEFILNNVNDPVFDEDEPMFFERKLFRYDVSAGLEALLDEYTDILGDIRYVGKPSFDGRGPQINVLTSIAISANSKNVNGCTQFLNVLLDKDVIIKGANGCAVINESATSEGLQITVDKYNEQVEGFLETNTPEWLMSVQMPWCIADDTVIDNYIALVSSCESLVLIDPSIKVIMGEEMQAYFAGQKTLDEVISIMNDRATTYIKEQGA